jgi:hypothetical protein
MKCAYSLSSDLLTRRSDATFLIYVSTKVAHQVAGNRGSVPSTRSGIRDGCFGPYHILSIGCTIVFGEVEVAGQNHRTSGRL